jgi:hypothetical protein
MWRRWLTVLSITGVVIAALWRVELAYSPIHSHASNYNHYQTNYEQNTSDYFAGIFRVVFWSLIDAIERHHDAWLVLETLALAAFTFTLWRSTNRLWLTSQEHARHMERSVEAAEAAAKAAQSSAVAARRSADTFPAIERAYLFAEGNPDLIRRQRFISNPETGRKEFSGSSLTHMGKASSSLPAIR